MVQTDGFCYKCLLDIFCCIYRYIIHKQLDILFLEFALDFIIPCILNAFQLNILIFLYGRERKNLGSHLNFFVGHILGKFVAKRKKADFLL